MSLGLQSRCIQLTFQLLNFSLKALSFIDINPWYCVYNKIQWVWASLGFRRGYHILFRVKWLVTINRFWVFGRLFNLLGRQIRLIHTGLLHWDGHGSLLLEFGHNFVLSMLWELTLAQNLIYWIFIEIIFSLFNARCFHFLDDTAILQRKANSVVRKHLCSSFGRSWSIS